jgi:D-glycero-D-manno-heptose 1,7-bisphosphate phosphatase
VTAAAFLDRDGVINRKPPEGRYVTAWEEFELLPGVPVALRALRERGFRLIVVTNQRGIARGLMTAAAVDSIHDRMNERLRETGAEVDAVFVCPHEADACDCRKPKTGLFTQALERYPDLTLPDSVVVGDSVADLEAGQALGCRVFLVASPERAAAVVTEAASRGIGIHGVAPSLLDLVSGDLIAAPSAEVSA